jgi:hypothetical protein
MSDQSERRSTRHQYPPFWERAVPVAVAVIALIILVLLAIIVGVALGLFPAGP